jgi:hypothetical protein
MKKVILCVNVFLLTGVVHSQSVGINTTGNVPKDAALLEVGEGTPPDTKGLLIPRVALTNVAVYAPLTGTSVTSLIVYSSTSPTNGNGVGYYFWSGSKWIYIPAPANGPGTTGQLLTSQGAGNPPLWQSISGGGGFCMPTSITNELDGTGTPVLSGNGISKQLLPCISECFNLVFGGFSDWRVPSTEELLNLIPIATTNTNTTYVWTVSPADASQTYSLVRLSDANHVAQSALTVLGTSYCRCVR